MPMRSAYPTLIAGLWPRGRMNNAVRATLLAVVGTLILWASAKVNVPFYPVPMTMQTMAVLLIGVFYGWRLGAATLLLYLVEGAVGLPVFAGTPARGIGLAYMVGPTGGYLVGFVLAAALTGWLAERGYCRSLPTLLASLLAGTVVIFLFGYLWLATLIGAERAFTAGVAPFLYGAVAKIALAAAIVYGSLRWVDRRGTPLSRE